MFRLLAALLGLAVVLAVFAGIYYAPENVELRERSGAFNLAAGEVRQEALQPSIPGSDIVVEVEVLQGTIDVYVMDKEWAGSLPEGGRLHLDAPFSYHAGTSATHVNGTYTFTLRSDGLTWMSVVFDNSDNYYDGDAVPAVDDADANGTRADDAEGAGTARVKVTARFVDEEERSLLLGYLAAVPSVLLVVVTLGRSWSRHRKAKWGQDPASAPAQKP